MLGPLPPVRFCLLVNDPTLSESAKSRELRGNVGYVGVWIAWVHGCVGWVGQIFTWVA